MTTNAVKSLRNVWFLDNVNTRNGLSLLGCIKGYQFFPSLGIVDLSGLPVMNITFWFIACSIIKMFSFATIFVERISVLEDGFVF